MNNTFTTDPNTNRVTMHGTADLISEGSWSESDLGKHDFTMEWFPGDDAGHATIEWDIPTLEQTEHIGLTFEMRINEADPRNPKRALTGYDGVMGLSDEAIAFIEHMGVIVDEEFKS